MLKPYLVGMMEAVRISPKIGNVKTEGRNSWSQLCPCRISPPGALPSRASPLYMPSIARSIPRTIVRPEQTRRQVCLVPATFS